VSVLLGAEASPGHLAGIAESLRRVTVEVHTTAGGGAGVMWGRDLVVTNAHVARRSPVRVSLADDREMEGRVVGVDAAADLALIRVAGGGIASAPIAEGETVRVGAIVVALGHPFGLRRTLTAGIVHAVAPLRPGGRRWIHADVRLAPGNSGGPLADTAGRVVGINTMIAGGLALAIPVDEVRRFVAATLARFA
jgi:serine protease Do